MKSITITISPTGESAVEAHQFKGSGCEAATQALEEALGTIRRRRRKADYHVRAAVRPESTQQTTS